VDKLSNSSQPPKQFENLVLYSFPTIHKERNRFLFCELFDIGAATFVNEVILIKVMFNINNTINNWVFDVEVFNFLYGDLTPEQREVLVPGKLRKKRVQNQYSVEDRYNSVFYKTYILPSLQDNSPIHDISTTLGKKFRRRFRVPFSVCITQPSRRQL
jgi:hypothetical protein